MVGRDTDEFSQRTLSRAGNRLKDNTIKYLNYNFDHFILSDNGNYCFQQNRHRTHQRYILQCIPDYRNRYSVSIRISVVYSSGSYKFSGLFHDHRRAASQDRDMDPRRTCANETSMRHPFSVLPLGNRDISRPTAAIPL